MDTLSKRFPVGLQQAEKGFRFGLDTLLLAAFALKSLPQKSRLLAELGSGCGATLIAIELVLTDCFALGFEKDHASLDCAKQNSKKMNLEKNIKFVHCDLRLFGTFYQDLFPAVLANPPYYEPNEGRCSKAGNNAKRMFHALEDFCFAASRLLMPHGYFLLIYPATKLQKLCCACERAHLGIRTLLPIAPQANSQATRFLVAARKNTKADTKVLPTLTIHGTKQFYTKECLAFCPWLNN
ncbi:MAG: methyltransferase domain-containing protein [Desulfovibrio sp.]|nr:methyltransferase domain-containing protein [Desulfovibrio sp.]